MVLCASNVLLNDVFFERALGVPIMNMPASRVSNVHIFDCLLLVHVLLLWPLMSELDFSPPSSPERSHERGRSRSEERVEVIPENVSVHSADSDARQRGASAAERDRARQQQHAEEHGGSDGEEPEDRRTGAESPGFKKRPWEGTTNINTKWFSSIGKELPVERLGWDHNLQHGQSRTLDDVHVAELMNSLTLRPPREALKVTVWQNDADRKYYLMAGQHLARAIQRLKEERLSKGLKLEKWMTVVRADVLKFNTPIDVRRTVAGQENASTKLARVTTVSECVRLFLMDESDNPLHDRIVKAVEQAGLNVGTVTPVCFSHRKR